ncbi:DUF2490 domain-containing protein [Candidatus Omnitrophota bacterium]
MKKICVITKILLILLIFDRNAYSGNDFQYWSSKGVSIKVKEYWKISLAEEFRFSNNASDFYYQHSDIGLGYSAIKKWLTLGINYRHIYEEKKGGWMVESRPHLNIAAKWKLYDCRFSNRGRFEYRIRENSNDVLRYRNKVTIKYSSRFSRLSIPLKTDFPRRRG